MVTLLVGRYHLAAAANKTKWLGTNIGDTTKKSTAAIASLFARPFAIAISLPLAVKVGSGPTATYLGSSKASEEEVRRCMQVCARVLGYKKCQPTVYWGVQKHSLPKNSAYVIDICTLAPVSTYAFKNSCLSSSPAPYLSSTTLCSLFPCLVNNSFFILLQTLCSFFKLNTQERGRGTGCAR